ncbi:MAG: biotin carboxylase [Leptospiraceae bacterium]|nr:biotin carboxylase [Leptospiraceae bacterium]MDW8307566.1 biotin carboxylase N-terminal domain-containing protein [Leptospiraceae bacterium]
MHKREIRTLLVANRGEIARRIFRTARRLGIRTVAIYDKEEKGALYIKEADLALELSGSFLDGEEIVDLAKQAGADAIHPGYGFLSEKSSFAELVEKEGLIFVGPSPQSIAEMGDKARARTLAAKAGVPVLPGFKINEEEPLMREELFARSREIGFPLLLKSSAGGGGKGMRIVYHEEHLLGQLESLREESLRLFRSANIVVERFLPNARHIEVQLLGNSKGKNFAIGDRDCSLQRFQQKIIEEAPAPKLSAATRQALHEAAVSLADSIAYQNAGTIEFLYDPSRESFYFLEMNTRLQVEHPVTELTSGLDLVEEQLKIAMGYSGRYESSCRGHAIEARICAEHPDGSFRPTTGTVLLYEEPLGVRVDSGIGYKSVVLSKFDNLLAKVVAYGDNRMEATIKLRDALQHFYIAPVQTNIPLLVDLLSSTVFEHAQMHTRYISEQFAFRENPLPPFALAAALYYDREKKEKESYFGLLANFELYRGLS